jgi:hypothetical protein
MYARNRGRGFGMYPTNADGTDNPCFDPNRPSWLPYWFDTPTESACKYGTTDFTGQVAGAASSMAAPIGATAGGLLSGAVGGAAQGVTSSISGTVVLIGVAVLAGVLALGMLHR